MMITIQDVITKLTKPVDKLEISVDKLVFGDPYTEVKGIVVAFVASHYVIQHAIDMGANLIITHEGTFYSHHDRIEHLEHDSVYRNKREMIDESGIAIYRFHDYWHKYQPDGIMVGLIQALGWTHYVEENNATSTLLTISNMTVKEIADYVKRKLSIPFVRVIGDTSMPCTRIGLLAGYRGGGDIAIPLFEQGDLDLIIYGEGPEWETPEYVRDAIYQGRNKALINIGHAASEEPGMEYLAELTKAFFPGIPVHFISEENSFQFL